MTAAFDAAFDSVSALIERRYNNKAPTGASAFDC
jgi:hypothetical protein